MEENVSKYDVSGIELGSEEVGDVLVYDTCDSTRRRIREHLAQPGITQTGFCREIPKTYSEATQVRRSMHHTFTSRICESSTEAQVEAQRDHGGNL